MKTKLTGKKERRKCVKRRGKHEKDDKTVELRSRGEREAGGVEGEKKRYTENKEAIINCPSAAGGGKKEIKKTQK